MEKKRVWLLNLAVVGGIVLLSLVLMLVTRLTPRQIVPNAGVLEGFEPAVTTQQPEGVPSSRLPGLCPAEMKEVIG